MANDLERFDAMMKLAENLGELEVTVGPAARPVVAEIRRAIRRARAARDNGDLPRAFEALRTAMARLIALGSELDPAEGLMMRMVAEQFAQALDFGDKGGLKETINLMRHKAGDPKDEPHSDW